MHGPQNVKFDTVCVCVCAEVENCIFLKLHFSTSELFGTEIIFIFPATSGTAVAQWLRSHATNRKVAGSIPAGVLGIFH